MTINELIKELEAAIQDGYGHAEVMFDTEGRSFDYHMAVVGNAFLETNFMPDRPILYLNEKRHA